jgi:decaprenyl-phosphate phosphoribosyltransferase
MPGAEPAPVMPPDPAAATPASSNGHAAVASQVRPGGAVGSAGADGKDAAARPAPAGHVVRDLVLLARPGQWVKSVLVVPLVLLDTRVWSAVDFERVALASVAFSLCSSFAYVINDVSDRYVDRAHPTKHLRPIAAGRVSLPMAWAFAVLLGCLTGALLAFLTLSRSWPILAYALLGVAYSRWLKHIPLVDVFVVALGFLLRVGEGFRVTGTPLSSWLPICVLCLCLLFALGKRRHELADTGARYRRALAGYSVPLIDSLILLASALSITAYTMFLTHDAPLGQYARVDTLLCVPFAIFGIFRYLQLLMTRREGKDPVRILIRDRPLVANSLALAVVQLAALLAAHYPLLARSILYKVA